MDDQRLPACPECHKELVFTPGAGVDYDILECECGYEFELLSITE